MARLVRYKPNVPGIRRLRASRGVDRELGQRAQNVADLAEQVYSVSYPDELINVEVVQAGSDTNEPRARVAVIARHPAALRIEAKHRVLGGSLDAARG